MISIDELPEVMKTGKCPHTNKAYDCVRCELKPRRDRKCPFTLHSCLCISGPFTDGRRWSSVLAYFDRDDRKEAKRILQELHRYGVEVVPVGSCDLEHFCFKHGCTGHEEKEENGQ